MEHSIDFKEGYSRGLLAAKFPKGFTCSCMINTTDEYREGFAQGFKDEEGKAFDDFFKRIDNWLGDDS